MSPRSFALPASEAVVSAETRLWISLGVQIRDGRTARGWTVAELARRAGVSRAVAYSVEAGHQVSAEAGIRLAHALSRRLEFQVVDPRRRADSRTGLSADFVHSAMGELETGHLRPMGFGVGIDEPYQHYQFAGRGDVVAWDLQRAALLHLENRTRFPDVQDTAASFNSKRAYLGKAIAERLGITRWKSETHVIVALWSAEVLHALRLRRQSFRAICPDPPEGFERWWRGDPPPTGQRSELVVLDPLSNGKQRIWIGLDEAMTVRPRHRGYAEVASALGATLAAV